MELHASCSEGPHSNPGQETGFGLYFFAVYAGKC